MEYVFFILGLHLFRVAGIANTLGSERPSRVSEAKNCVTSSTTNLQWAQFVAIDRQFEVLVHRNHSSVSIGN